MNIVVFSCTSFEFTSSKQTTLDILESTHKIRVINN